MKQGEDWPREWTARIGRAVQAARKKRGLSAQALSDRCSAAGFPIPRNTITNLENGRKETVPVHELVVLAKVIGESLGDLLFPIGLDGGPIDPIDLSETLRLAKAVLEGDESSTPRLGVYDNHDFHVRHLQTALREPSSAGRWERLRYHVGELRDLRKSIMPAFGIPLPPLPREVEEWLSDDSRRMIDKALQDIDVVRTASDTPEGRALLKQMEGVRRGQHQETE